MYTDNVSIFIEHKCICPELWRHGFRWLHELFYERCIQTVHVSLIVCVIPILLTFEIQGVWCNIGVYMCVCVFSSSLTGRSCWENRPWNSLCPPSPTPPPLSSSLARGTSTVSETMARFASWRSWSSTPAASSPTLQVTVHLHSPHCPLVLQDLFSSATAHLIQ